LHRRFLGRNTAERRRTESTTHFLDRSSAPGTTIKHFTAQVPAPPSLRTRKHTRSLGINEQRRCRSREVTLPTTRCTGFVRTRKRTHVIHLLSGEPTDDVEPAVRTTHHPSPAAATDRVGVWELRPHSSRCVEAVQVRKPAKRERQANIIQVPVSSKIPLGLGGVTLLARVRVLAGGLCMRVTRAH
jgi:hypothetical protein